MEIICFSAECSLVPLVLCIYTFVCFRLVCTSGWFVLPVGLYERKITTANPILTIMFKNILRTFEAEILKVFKSIQP